MYSDFTQLSAQVGIHVETLEMCDHDEMMKNISEEEIKNKLDQIKNTFEISEGSKSDSRVTRPSDDQLYWSAKVAVAEEKLVNTHDLDALSYYYHSVDNNPYEDLQSGLIVGNSLLTANHVPCAGEGDIKTCLAMKICDLLDTGGSFCEIVVTDYINNTILIGHDGPFHIKISDQKPILRGLGVYHGKKGSGVSVEAKVKEGDVTTLNVTQLSNGKLKFIVSEAYATNDKIMQIGNTQTHVRFKYDVDEYMDRWFKEAPTHHCALSVGHNASLFLKIGDLLNIETVVL
jgi:L-arabinose isomerase